MNTSSAMSHKNHVTSRNRTKSRGNFEIPRLRELASPSPRQRPYSTFHNYIDRDINVGHTVSDRVNMSVSDGKMLDIPSVEMNHKQDRENPNGNTPKMTAHRHYEGINGESEREMRLPFSPISNSIGNRNRRRNEGNARNAFEGVRKDIRGTSLREGTTNEYFTPKSNSNRKKRRSFHENDPSLSNSKTKRSREKLNELQEQRKSSDQDNNTKKSIQVYQDRSVNSSNILGISLEFPKILDVSPSFFKAAFRESRKSGIHQRQLCESGCNQLSLTEVIIPAIFHAHNVHLKKMEGKALGKCQKDAVRKIQMLRCALKAAEGNVIRAVEELRNGNAEKRRIERFDAKQARIERAQEEKERKEKKRLVRKAAKKKAILEARAKNRERRRMERKTKSRKTKELLREFVSLMTDLDILEREEKSWKEINFEVPNTRNECESVHSKVELEDTFKQFEDERNICSTMTQSIAQGISVSANRINNVLCEVSSLIEKSERIKNEAYEKYRKDHKFHDYLGQKDAKALIRAMILK